MSDSFPIVAIGCSWGGLEALSALLEGLPDELPVAVVIVQHRLHRPSELASLLAAHTTWPVCEADDKEGISPCRVYLAPPGYHLLVDGDRFALSTEAPVRNSRPSVDVLFESVAAAYGPRVIGVVLTGANDDGAEGLRQVVAAGGAAVVQDPATAERPTMPRAALATGIEATVVALRDLGPTLAAVARARLAATEVAE
jgi:two-component system, chemotaxis family, protein-glutamate methylesterase/glutaminase